MSRLHVIKKTVVYFTRNNDTRDIALCGVRQFFAQLETICRSQQMRFR